MLHRWLLKQVTDDIIIPGRFVTLTLTFLQMEQESQLSLSLTSPHLLQAILYNAGDLSARKPNHITSQLPTDFRMELEHSFQGCSWFQGADPSPASSLPAVSTLT